MFCFLLQCFQLHCLSVSELQWRVRLHMLLWKIFNRFSFSGLQVGMQNSSLGVVLATAHFSSSLVTLPPALSAVIMNIMGSTLGLIWQYIAPSVSENETTGIVNTWSTLAVVYFEHFWSFWGIGVTDASGMLALWVLEQSCYLNYVDQSGSLKSSGETPDWIIVGGPTSGLQTACLNYLGECPALVYGRQGGALSIVPFLGGITLEFLSCIGWPLRQKSLGDNDEPSLNQVACHLSSLVYPNFPKFT